MPTMHELRLRIEPIMVARDRTALIYALDALGSPDAGARDTAAREVARIVRALHLNWGAIIPPDWREEANLDALVADRRLSKEDRDRLIAVRGWKRPGTLGAKIIQEVRDKLGGSGDRAGAG